MSSEDPLLYGASRSSDTRMEGVLWYVLASSRGGPTRVRICLELAERPRNPNQLAERLDMDYTTIRHHLDVLCENGVLEPSGDDYGAVYLFTDQARSNWETIEEIFEAMAVESTENESEETQSETASNGEGSR